MREEMDQALEKMQYCFEKVGALCGMMDGLLPDSHEEYTHYDRCLADFLAHPDFKWVTESMP